MARRRRILVITGIVALLVTPLLILLAAPMLYAGLVAWIARSTTGAEVAFSDLDVGLFPVQVSVSDLALRNPEFERPLLTARQVSATVFVGDWLGAAPTWWRATGDGIHVRLEQNAGGNSNWQLGGTQPSGTAGGPGPLLDFSLLRMADLSVTRVADGIHRFQVNRLYVAHEADERIRVEAEGSYRKQPLRVRGTLALPTSEQARDVHLRANVFGSTLRVDGTVGHEGIVPGRVGVSLALRDPQGLATLLDMDLAPFTPLSLAGTVRTPRSGSWQVDLDGEVAGRPAKFAAELHVTADRFALSGMNAALGDTRLQGEATVDTRRRSLQARMDAPRVDLNQLLALAGSDETPPSAASHQAPGSVPWALPGVLRSWRYEVAANVAALSYGKRRVTGIELSLERPANGEAPAGNRADAVLEVSAQGLDAHAEVEVDRAPDTSPRLLAQGRLDNLDAFADLDSASLRALLPLAFDVTLSGTGDGWQIDLTRLGIAGSDMSGKFDVEPQANPMRIAGSLRSRRLDIDHFPTSSQLGPAQQSNGERASTEASDGDVIPDSPIDWSWLEAASVDVNARVEELAFNRTTFRDVRGRIELQDGKLRVDPLDATLTEGGVRGHLEVAARRNGGARLQTFLAVSQLVPADLGLPGSGFIDGGATDLLVDLRAEGRSPQDLAGTLNGELALEVQQATIRNQLFEPLTADLMTQTLSLINPFVEQDPQTDLQCAAAHIVADQGVLRTPNRLVVETSKVVIRAGGKLDLHDESLTLDFVPSPREGLGISVAGLAELVRIGGTLARPEIRTDASAILKGGATIGAAIGTGGLSLLAQGLFTRLRNEGTRCGEIFEQQTDLPQPIRVSKR